MFRQAPPGIPAKIRSKNTAKIRSKNTSKIRNENPAKIRSKNPVKIRGKTRQDSGCQKRVPEKRWANRGVV